MGVGGDKESEFGLFLDISLREGLASLGVSEFEFCVGVLNGAERV